MRTTISVSSSPDLLRLGSEFARRKDRLLAEAASRMSVEVAKRAPGGPGGKVGRSFHAVGQAVVSSFRGAKALDVGAYIVPKKRQTKSGRRPMLRFQGEGGVVFRPSARIPAHHYIRSALRRRRSVVDSAVRRVYGDLLG